MIWQRWKRPDKQAARRHYAETQMLPGRRALRRAAVSTLGQGMPPDRPVRMIVTTAAGGGIDLMARLVAERLGESLGRQVVVENQGGASGTLASNVVARATPDGTTLLFTSVSIAINAATLKNSKYDPLVDLAPVSLVSQYPLVLVVSSDTPANSIPEFISLVRKNPEKYTYASAGVGTSPHLATELFKTMASVDLRHIPYKGNAAALPDLFAGRITMLIDGVPAQLQNIADGRVKALGVTSKTRSSVLPNVPTIAESGVPNYEVTYWTGIFAPAGTPKKILDQISAATKNAVENPQVAKRLAELGAEGVGSSPAVLGDVMKKDVAKYTEVVNSANISVVP